ncbi:YezD family protein [Novosphingobium sp. MW5]|nr:YezD family protein [Novosphingobium sp. MW5]
MDSNRDDRSKSAQQPAGTSSAALEAVADAVSRLRYGAIELTVHDGRVVQLDVTERRRFS